MKLQRVIYVSKVGQKVRLKDAESIARESAQRNASCGITGYLFYTPGHFIQVLEGDTAAVESTYARIALDDRHSDMKRLSVEAIEERKFGDWSMGFAFSNSLDVPADDARPGEWDPHTLLEQLVKAAG